MSIERYDCNSEMYQSHYGSFVRFDDHEAELAALRIENDTLRARDRDGELLDWLERNPRHESAPYFDDEAGAWGFPYEVSNAGGHGGGVGFRHFGSLRAAIDAAIAAEGE